MLVLITVTDPPIEPLKKSNTARFTVLDHVRINLVILIFVLMYIWY